MRLCADAGLPPPLRLAGYEVLRFTYRQVANFPGRVAAAVASFVSPQAARRPK